MTDLLSFFTLQCQTGMSWLPVKLTISKCLRVKIVFTLSYYQVISETISPHQYQCSPSWGEQLPGLCKKLSKKLSKTYICIIWDLTVCLTCRCGLITSHITWLLSYCFLHYLRPDLLGRLYEAQVHHHHQTVSPLIWPNIIKIIMLDWALTLSGEMLFRNWFLTQLLCLFIFTIIPSPSCSDNHYSVYPTEIFSQ